jgi:hypothetical protein
LTLGLTDVKPKEIKVCYDKDYLMRNLTLTVGVWDAFSQTWTDTTDLPEHGYKPEFTAVGAVVNLIKGCETVKFDMTKTRTLTEIWLHTDPKYVNVEAVTWKWSDGTA